jgi:Protein of unknown function (DUF2844)
LHSRRYSIQSYTSCILPLLCLAAVLTPLSAFAALGGDMNSVVNDEASLHGSLLSTPTSSFTIHEIHSQSGTVIREYMSRTGTVFAVSWSGPWLPDMKQLLGPYFQQYESAAQAQTSVHGGRRPLQIAQPEFVFQLSGHPRSFVGRAYLPNMLPPNVQAEAIQ